MTMIYSTIIIYYQSVEKNGSIVKNALVYYSLNITIYFFLYEQLSLPVDNSRIFAQISTVIILLIFQIKIFNFDSIFSSYEWKEILKYITSIAFHVIFGLTLTYLDKASIFWFFEDQSEIKYSFLVLYFMPFAAFYNQLFNAAKPEIYRKTEAYFPLSKLFVLNIAASGLLLTIYSGMLYYYLNLMSIDFSSNLFILVALVTFTWTHYLVPASIMIYNNRNASLSKVSFIFCLIGFGIVLLLRDIQWEVDMVLKGYILLILCYNLTLQKMANDL